MLRSLRKRLTYANVMSTLAVAITLGTGTAYATHELINSSDVVNESLLSVDLKDGQAVKGSDVTNSSLTGDDVGSNSLTGDDIRRERSPRFRPLRWVAWAGPQPKNSATPPPVRSSAAYKSASTFRVQRGFS